MELIKEVDPAGGKKNVRVVLAGVKGTGKSTLIATAVTEKFPETVVPVLPPSKLVDIFYAERVPITIIDTSSRHRYDIVMHFDEVVCGDLNCVCTAINAEDREKLVEELRSADVTVPVIVTGCRLDLRNEQLKEDLGVVMGPTTERYLQIETCIECSAKRGIEAPDVFFYAQKAVIYPAAPLFVVEVQVLRPRCRRALKRIFILIDQDRDGALNNEELNNFQSVELTADSILFLTEVFKDHADESVGPKVVFLTPKPFGSGGRKLVMYGWFSGEMLEGLFLTATVFGVLLWDRVSKWVLVLHTIQLT
ncbi:hypothetical protein Drorol1_Dr00001962 [Drosera rotundifolia]